MAGEPLVTVSGNVAADPEIKYLPSGVAVCNFSVAATPRIKQGEHWADGETLWLRCTAWRQLAENAAESLLKGVRVIVQGRLKVRTYEVNGERRTSMEMDVDEVGPSLRFATTKVLRAERSGPRSSPPPVDDPWNTRSGDESEIPF